MTSSTREALLEHGAILFARCGVEGVTARELHSAAGAKNESALHYHFGDRAGLVEAILRRHFEAVEERRAPLVADIERGGRTDDLRALVGCLAIPMADDLNERVGRAHLRLVATLNHPSMAFDEPFRSANRLADATSGGTVARWLVEALPALPARVRAERLVVLREQLIGLFAQRARLLDDDAEVATSADTALFVENLLDVVVAGLVAVPTPATLAASRKRTSTPRRGKVPR